MEAIQYKLSSFEGPLDLLLFLISKNKLSIWEISLGDLVDQYMEHIEAMRENDLDVASEFLEMAARLVYIKTVSLLPKHEQNEEVEKELKGQLLEYQLCREMAAKLQAMGTGFGRIVREPMKAEENKEYGCIHLPELLVSAYLNAVGRGFRRVPPPAALFQPLVTQREVSVSSRVIHILRRLRKQPTMRYFSIYDGIFNRSELVATFMAVLELVRAGRVTLSGERDREMLMTLNTSRRREDAEEQEERQREGE
ncbi:MAG: segregation/condensation protein A [Clostridia bacterium]|nr:segregation/condensation protein A [Clostridia bacterium]